MGQLTAGAAGFSPSIRPGRAFRRGCGMVGYGYGGLGSRPRSGRGQAFRGDDGLGVRTSFEIVSKRSLPDSVQEGQEQEPRRFHSAQGHHHNYGIRLLSQRWRYLGGSIVYSLAATVIGTVWTEAVPGLRAVPGSHRSGGNCQAAVPCNQVAVKGECGQKHT